MTKQPQRRRRGPKCKDYIVIFGAAVRPGGRPSPALRHRIEGALAWACDHPSAMIMPTGGIGKYGPAEAVAMKRALMEAGVAASQIVVERYGRDTLESVRLCHQLLQARGDCRRIVCCTSTYHQPRCVLLFRLLGYSVVVPKVPNSMGRMSRTTYGKLVVRELAATPYDSLLLMLGRDDKNNVAETSKDSPMSEGPET
nr:YdcF family protein [Microvirga sp. SRT01]